MAPPIKMTAFLKSLASAALLASAASGETDVPLKNAAFTEGIGPNGAPLGWSLYGGRGTDRRISVVDDGHGGKAALLDDGSPETEVGLTQAFPAAPNTGYEVRVRVRAIAGAPGSGAYVQLRFLPSNIFAQAPLLAKGPEEYDDVAIRCMSPPDTQSALIYIYSHRSPTPKVLIGGVRLAAGVQPPRPLPAPVPPQFSKLKDLCLTTQVVLDGKPSIKIVAPASGIHRTQAARLQEAVEKMTRCRLPIVPDTAPEARVPTADNLIVLGNRSTNATISELYNLYLLLTDLRYPGPEGFEVRTLHNPFGKGKNVIVAGGSDAAGVNAATDALIAALRRAQAPHSSSLSVGWLLEAKLGPGLAVPRDVRQMETWEASAGYRSTGYFGWNSISKRMAAYYMSGDPFHAHEALRLAFPDKQAFREITEIDGEMIERKDDPLAGPYHYNAHLMILFWDLIEESPVFSDEQRLKVTNAFARQLSHRKDEGIYPLTQTPSAVGSRHGQWSAISLYCLGRYFQRDYPDPVWEQCVRGAKLHFSALEESAWINGESDNLFWYCTGIAPVFSHMLLTGDRTPMRNGVAAALLRAQEVLVSGRTPDWALRSAALDYLHKAAFLTHDGRWLTYRDRTGIDTNVFRLGQSFWPDEDLKPAPPDDLVGRWTINPLPEPHWRARQNDLPRQESFYNASFRSSTDASGDFVLIDGFNGASRNPYHTFAILELRLDGRTILQGYLNQVLTKADGMVEPKVAMDAALRRADVLGRTAICVAETPGAAFCNWRRTLAQCVGRYALIVDDLAFRHDSDNMEVRIVWQNTDRPFRLNAKRGTVSQGDMNLHTADPTCSAAVGPTVTQEWRGAARNGRHGIFFTLIAKAGASGCRRLAENAAALTLPEKAACIVGEWEGNAGDIVLLAEDHLTGVGLTQATATAQILQADKPIDLEWDFPAGRLEVVAREPTRITLAVADSPTLLTEGAVASHETTPDGRATLRLNAGRAVVRGIRPPETLVRALSTRLAAWADRAGSQSTVPPEPPPESLPTLASPFTTRLAGPIEDLVVLRLQDRELTAAASRTTIHLLDTDGRESRQMQTDGKIRQLHFWPEHSLLLAGCADEKVCAFDLEGNRKWTFVSEMDPAVFRAAKQYWFKTAPGHEGIHGIDSGTFLNEKTQAFVGSACTLEIIDEKGKLIKRLPQFWGTVHKFALLPGPEGSINLLASRKITDVPTLAVINSRTLDPAPRGFQGVPVDHTLVGGWMDQTRHHIFVEDLDANGKLEVLSEITGAWNRVTVWDVRGTPLHNVQFGPGSNGPGRHVRDIDAGDLNGDGRKEIVVGLSNGLVLALNTRCEKLWARRMAGPPAVLKIIAGSILVATGSGSVLMLDGAGQSIAQASIGGCPVRLQELKSAPVAILASDTGELRAFSIQAAQPRKP